MKTYELKVPIDMNGATYHRVSLRRATAGDMAAQERIEGPLAKVILMISRLSGLPEEVVENIDVVDFNEISVLIPEVMGTPLPVAPPPGPTPSP